ncbi:respiratory burst oxidase like protein e [Quercus suber]|uniref:Respiratory burst oxidase like protein e n=1 Tax=Quercus suber TaxID=58331 RepID=A0AAW0LC47_QUESU
MRLSASSSKRSNYSRSFDLQDDLDDSTTISGGGGEMLPIFLNGLGRQSNSQDIVEVTIELEDDSVVMCSVTPTRDELQPPRLERNLSITSRIRRKFPWLRSSSNASETDSEDAVKENTIVSARDDRRMKASLQRSRSNAQQALKGLRFISSTSNRACDSEELWRKVESRFHKLAKDGLLCREDFGECIGMVDSKEFAVGIFDALARRRRQKIARITKEELHDFWLQISDQRWISMRTEKLQGRRFKSASANKLSKLKEQAEDYASLIMEELDPEKLGYIELETLLLQRDTYMNYSRPLSTASVGWSQNLGSFRPKNVMQRVTGTLRTHILENWQRGWILMLWFFVMAGLFALKFNQYRNRAAFQVMGYCVTTAKGAAETLKLNMALILLPVCRNTLTWLRSTRAKSFIPFNDNINFHKTIACAIAIGIFIHAGTHLACDFPRIINSSPEDFALIASDIGNTRPTYKGLLSGVEGVTGIAMVVLMAISFTLATQGFRRNLVKLPAPFNRLTGFNAFWYSHHLLGLVYILLLVHGTCLFLVQKWEHKTSWMYISVPLLLYIVERTVRTRRSERYSVKVLKVSVLPGNVFSLVMSKPQGFKYESGQYIFLQCPTISPFEWHPFSITSASGDDYLSVHIRIAGDWTQELKRIFTEGTHLPPSIIGPAKLSTLFRQKDQTSQPRLLVDGPYGAPAQDYKNYDVLLLDSTTETSRSDDRPNSFTSSNVTPGSGKKKLQRVKSAHFYWVTREPGSFEWFKGVMDQVAEMDHKGQIELHNYLTSVYEEHDARSTLITMVQALNHAKHGVDILSGTRVRTHFARPNWKEAFTKIASKHPHATVGVFYCGLPVLAKELKKLCHELSNKTSTRFEFHKEYF